MLYLFFNALGNVGPLLCIITDDQDTTVICSKGFEHGGQLLVVRYLGDGLLFNIMRNIT
ncbi:hypothetical protein D3C76_1778220 [compost metagenome]